MDKDHAIEMIDTKYSLDAALILENSVTENTIQLADFESQLVQI